jgi:hypothetical protein
MYIYIVIYIIIFYKGEKFWKSAKKIRAVTLSDYTKVNPSITISSSGSDSDINQPLQKKSLLVKVSTLESKLDDLISRDTSKEDNLKDEVKRLKEFKQKYDTLKKCFECVICKNTLKFPMTVSTCCSNILGCVECTNTWFLNSATCPFCRTVSLDCDCITIQRIRPLEECLED